MTTHTYRTIDVPVAGGALCVGIWDPVPGSLTAADSSPPRDVLAVHGVTSSHLAWPFVVAHLPGVRVIAPDLRGRGRSNALEGPAGLRAHAADLAAVLDALDIERALVLGHSMGAFVAVVFADLHPARVSRLVLVDGGLPLDVPAGLDTDALVSSILGPTAARLSRRFADVGEYLDFWRQHPAFRSEWSAELEQYLAYDLVDDGAGALRPATSYAVTAEDTVDLNTGTALPAALAGMRHPTLFVSVPRGLQNETPGLYAPEYLDEALAVVPSLRHVFVDGFNHYTIVLSDAGGAAVAGLVSAELAAGG